MDAAAQRHQQLKNEANKMAMKIPFFHGDDKEDALDIKEMIRRFKNSADAMGLADNAEKCNMFGNYLRGPAAVIWEGMDFYGESKVDWNSVKKYFLKVPMSMSINYVLFSATKSSTLKNLSMSHSNITTNTEFR